MKSFPSLAVQVVPFDAKLRADVLFIPVHQSKKKVIFPLVKGLSQPVAGRFEELAANHNGLKEVGAIDDQILPARSSFKRIAAVNLGKEKEIKTSDILKAAGLMTSWCLKHKIARAALAVDPLIQIAGEDALRSWVEGGVMASFRFTERRSKPPEENGSTFSKLVLATTSKKHTAMTSEANRGHILADAANLARRLGHEPPNVITPITLAKRCQALAKENKLRCKILDDRRMLAMKMGAISAVGQGASSKPRMIILEHPGSRPSSQPIVLVGKALTIDTGGYCVKPGSSIPDMKYDKQGGMAVIGAMVAAAKLKLKQRVIGIIGAAENKISRDAYIPGDIIRAYSGTTIEVLNTDAEGRLVMADCLTYGEKTYKPSAIIDLATLTGACLIALGNACGGLMATDDKLAEALIDAGERTDERLWRLPMWPVYREQITATDADIKNIGGREAGTITAGMFLKEFVTDKTPFAHLDIAGVATTTKQLPTCPVGATGFGVRLLIDYISRQTK